MSTMGSADDVASELQALSLDAEREPVVLLFKHGRACNGLREPKALPDLQAICPGLLQIVSVSQKQPLEAMLVFRNWNSAAKAVVGLWVLRLQGAHSFTPQLLDEYSEDQAFTELVNHDLKEVFLGHLASLETGEEVSACKSELDNLKTELLAIQKKLKQNNSVSAFNDLMSEKANMVKRIQTLGEQLTEYLNALKSLELGMLLKVRLEGKEELFNEIDDATLLLRLGSDWTWHQLHCLIERENRRLRERLPLYAKRSDILRQIHGNQVLVLNGETGSGKSTQLVQYIVDAGFIKDGSSIVCTQPRRVAVMTLFDRVTEECKGCSAQDPLVGYLISPSLRTEQFPKVMFMTDHALLQLCLSDETLSQFEYILVDEAHERSLNTDLLLAMLKRCLALRPNFKVIIMSATADTELLSHYFGGCAMYQVVGRSFPVHFIYSTDEEDESQCFDSGHYQLGCGRHAAKVIQTVISIHSRSEAGDVLAFLTSQAEVEWACSQQFGSSALVLPLHGRLQSTEQQLVFKATPEGMRKIIFATNIAETSLTIPGIKFVVDCGLVKESCVDPKNGMNVLKVCQIDRSAAMQRAGRAGRTQAGVCYRLYSELVFEAMAPQRMPEILRVHLGVAMLKLTALGVQKIESFDFIDSPNPAAISLAVENLCQLGAINVQNGKSKLTPLGWQLAKLGVDPILGFIALKSLSEGFGKEGLVIAGLLSCSGSIFFRAGSDEEKLRSDCLKMRFCHPHGDIFTLMSVYQEWDSVPSQRRNRWCVQNSINAKSMRRCQDFIKEIKCSIKTELLVDVPSLWTWSAVNTPKHCSEMLRKILLFSMPKNVAVFSGHEHTGYDVVSLEKQALLHPSSSCLVFGQFPIWVIFGNLLCTSREFLTSVTVVDPQWLSEVNLLPPYDVPALESRRMHKTSISNLNRCLLSRLCGRNNKAIKLLTNKILQGIDQRCLLEADYDRGEFHIYSTPDLSERAELLVKEAIEHQKKWLNNEFIEKCVFTAAVGMSSPVMLFGAGAETRGVLMQGEFVTVEILDVGSEIEDHEVCSLFDKCAGGVAGFHRDAQPGSSRKWGTMTFHSQKGAAEAVALLHNTRLGTHAIEVKPFFTSYLHEGNRPFVPVVKANLLWPRRQASGHAIVRCKGVWDQQLILASCSHILIGGSRISCKPDRKNGLTGVFIAGLGPGVTESEISQALQQASKCIPEDVHVLRLPARDQPDVDACRAALEQEIEQFVRSTKFKALVLGSHSDYYNRAIVSFDECEHEGAARAIAHLQGARLPICKSWQTISCQNTFFSSVQCSGVIYSVLKDEISELVTALKQQNEDAELTLTTRDGKGGCHIKISAGSLRVAAGCKSAFERLLEGTPMGEGIDKADIRLMFTREGLQMAKSVEMQTKTYIVCDKRIQVVKVFGATERKNRALSRLAKNLSQLQARKECHEIELRGSGKPSGLMRELVRKFGFDLRGLVVKLGIRTSLSLDQRRHVLLVQGVQEDLLKVEKVVEEVANFLQGTCYDTRIQLAGSQDCGICFCELEDKYSLVGCGHNFCRACVREQILSATRHREGFPLTCAYPLCAQKLLLVDLETLLTAREQEELQKASLCAFVVLNQGQYKFCTTPDCPAVYRVTTESKLFHCGACAVRLCTSCNGQFHLGLTCREYEEFKQDPDLSLKAWRRGKQHVKCCPSCGSTIEKVDGCNHVLCNCKTHICWLCREPFQSSEDCYSHLQSVHGGFI